MNFEKNENQKNPLYPERASVRLIGAVEDLKRIEAGDFKKIELSESEKEEVLEFENSLGEKLEKIFKKVIAVSTLYPEYFLTGKGRNDLKETAGIEIGGDEQGIIRELLSQRNVIAAMNSKDRTALAGRSRIYSDGKLLENMLSKMDEDGNIDVAELKAPEKISIIANGGRTLEKVEDLRNFKQELKKIRDEIRSDSRENVYRSKAIVLGKYTRRVNELLAQEYHVGVSMKKLADLVGADNLSEDEKKLLDLFTGLTLEEKNYSRYDKFIHGAGAEYRADGQRVQISEEIEKFANELEKEYLENELNKKNNAESKGLDWEKLNQKDVDCSQFSILAEELLEQYGQKSSCVPAEYFKDREGAVADDKWQFVARPEYKEMSVSSLQKAIFSPMDNKSIQDTIAVMLGHELEGHFMQALNREKVGLRIAKKVGTDRLYILAEGGAMMVQDKVTQEAFGYKTLPWVHYVKAMARKLEGGNYLDCVKSFYDSALKVSQVKKEEGVIQDSEFQEEAKSKLKLAIDRTKRLFRENINSNVRSDILTKSKDTVYLEQMILLDKMKKEGMEKYALVGGCDPASFVDFVKAGLINPEKIREPEYFSLKVWERSRSKYLKS
jgi:hypothetical protein